MPVFTKNGKNILFIHIPKCGGSAINDVFRRMGYKILLNMSGLPPQESLVASPQHLTWTELKNVIKYTEINEIFTVARNPYERLMSEYSWVTRSIDNPIELPDFDQWAMDQISKAMVDPNQADNHIRPMVDFIPSDLSCKVFRYEAGLSIISEMYAAEDNIYPPLMRELKRISRPGSIGKAILQREELLSGLRPSSLEAINNYYKDDFMSFLYPLRSSGVNPGDLATNSNASIRQDIAHALALTSQECITRVVGKLQEVRNSSQSIRKTDLEAFAERLSDSKALNNELRSELKKSSQELLDFKEDCKRRRREIIQLKSDRDKLLSDVENLQSSCQELTEKLVKTEKTLTKVQCSENEAIIKGQRALEELEECYLLLKDRDRLLSERDHKLAWNREKLQQCIAFAKHQEAPLRRGLNLIVRLAHEFPSSDHPDKN